MTLRIGVDTGGTFTDLCAFDEATGQVHVRKVSSTPDDPGRAIVLGIQELLQFVENIRLAGCFVHQATRSPNSCRG